MTENKKRTASQNYLFLGPELGEKQIAINEVKKKIGEGEGLEEIIYYAGDSPVSSIVSNMLNGSLFSDRRIFYIKCAELLKKKDEIDLLASYMESPAEDTYLILISEETSISKTIDNRILQSNKKIFYELLDSRKIQWVTSFFKDRGYCISTNGIDTILELVENNTASLKQECSRLTLFLDKEKEIDGEDVEKWLSHTREESSFTLFTRIAAGDFSRSLESIRMLLAAKESPVGIFAALSSCFRKLLAYLALKEAGVNSEAEYRKIGIIAPGAKRDYGSAGDIFDSHAAESALALTCEYDFLIRSSNTYPELILFDQFLYKIHLLGRGKNPS